MEPRDIIDALLAKGMTQAEIAARVDVQQPAISKVVRGATDDIRSATYRKLLALHAEKCGKDALDIPPSGVSVANF